MNFDTQLRGSWGCCGIWQQHVIDIQMIMRPFLPVSRLDSFTVSQLGTDESVETMTICTALADQLRVALADRQKAVSRMYIAAQHALTRHVIASYRSALANQET